MKSQELQEPLRLPLVTSQTDGRARAGTQAIDRGLGLLELIAGQPLTVREIAELTEMPRTTVARLVGALERHGYVARSETGSFILGAHVLTLAAQWHRQTGLVQVARPHLERLVRQTEETGHIMIREGAHVVCVDYVESRAPIRLSIRIGMEVPLNAGAHAKVLLAFAPEPLIDDALAGRLQALTPRTYVDPEALRDELARIRREGCAESRGEVDIGANAVAAPIHDSGGEVVASVGISWPDQRNGDQPSWVELRSAALETAAAISSELGYQTEAAAP